MRAFVQRTGMFPITHTVVMNKGLADREPWIARSMTQAFCDAQDVCDAHLKADPKHTSLPDMVHFLEDQRAELAVGDRCARGEARRELDLGDG